MYQQYVGYAIQERQFRSGQRDLSRGNKGNYVFAKIRLKLRIHSRFFKTHFFTCSMIRDSGTPFGTVAGTRCYNIYT